MAVESERPVLIMPNPTTDCDGIPVPLPPELMTGHGHASKSSTSSPSLCS
jgi:hypothetical protein